MKRCPPQDRLEQFLEERLSDADREAVAKHVGACDRCQAALEDLTRDGSGADETPSPCLLKAAQAPASLGQSQAAFLVQLKEDRSFRILASGNGSQGTAAASDAGGSAPAKFPTLANYEILAELGRGGMGVVYKARQISLNRLVALKMILAGSHAATKDLARFRQEAEAVARLRHPNIIQIYDIGEAEGRPFFALEFVEGDSLAHLLRGTPQPSTPAARLTETLARAVQYAHQQGIIHRDLKPANILLQHDERAALHDEQEKTDSSFLIRRSAVAKITDFGLAKRVDAHSSGGHSEEVVGTPSYMAPEQGMSNAAIGPAADVYALGAIFYELLTGRPPFRGPTSLETVVQVLHEEPARPSYLRPDLPRDLETICLKCLAKDPAKRYASAEALAEDLYRFRHGKPILARPVGMHERIWKWAKHRPLSAALVAGIILVTVLGFAGVTWQWQEARLARDEKEIQAEAADRAHDFAVEQWQKALNARNEADEKRRDALKAQAMEIVQRKKARASLYYSRIAQSQLQWRVNDSSSAYQSLAKCLPKPGEEDHRGWEWHYLQGLFHSALFSLDHTHGGLGGGVAFDPRNRWIVSVVGGYPDDENVKLGEVRIWDARTGGLVRSLPGPGTLHRLAFCPDGKQFALGMTDGQVLVRDALTGSETLRRQVHNDLVSGLAYHPDGLRVATSSWDKTVKIWDGTTGEILHVLRGHTDKVQSVAYHPDGKLLASCSWDSTVKVWDATTGKELKTLRRHKRPVYCVAFSPDGKLLVSASRTGTLRIWDLETGAVVQSLTGDTGSVLSIAFSPDGRYFAKGGKDGSVRVWDLESGVERIAFRGHTHPVEGVHFSPDCGRVVSVSPGMGVVKVWDLTRHPEYSTFARSDADLEAIAFHEDGKRFVSVNMAGKLQFWDAATGLLLEERMLLLHKETVSPGMPASFSPSGLLLAGRDANEVRTVKTWETATGVEKAAFRGLSLPVQCVRFSPDGRYLAICGCDIAVADQPHEVTVWNAATGQRLASFAGRGRIFHVAFSPDGERLAWGYDAKGEIAAQEGGSFALVDWKLPNLPRRIVAHKTAIGALAFSPDGKLLASAGLEDRAVRIWKVDKLLTDGKKAWHLLAAPLFLCDLSFSPDSKRLAGVSRDQVKMWEVETGHEVLSLRGAAQRYADPPFNPRVAFSPDGLRLAATNWDESISIWEAPRQNTPEDISLFQAGRREVADKRTAFWHLQEAEYCLEHKNFRAADFHLERVGNVLLPKPLQFRRDRMQAVPRNPAGGRVD
jgi:WD40 repeat protein/serine/threonine protein kinase